MLGVNDSTVANWRHGRATPDDAMTIRLATMAGVDLAEALAAMNAQRCTDGALRAVWETLAARAKQAGAAVLTAILSAVITGTPDAQARASVEELAPGAVQTAVVKNIHWRAFCLGFSRVLALIQGLALPIGDACST